MDTPKKIMSSIQRHLDRNTELMEAIEARNTKKYAVVLQDVSGIALSMPMMTSMACSLADLKSEIKKETDSEKKESMESVEKQLEMIFSTIIERVHKNLSKLGLMAAYGRPVKEMTDLERETFRKDLSMLIDEHERISKELGGTLSVQGDE